MITINEIYNSLVQLVIHAESVAWSRFSGYLMANSILILAWVAIFDASTHKLILFIICILGIIAGIAFSLLGYRSKAFLNKYLEIGSYIESDSNCWPNGFNQNYKPITKTVSLRDNLRFTWFGGRYVLICGPILFIIFYAILLFITFTTKKYYW